MATGTSLVPKLMAKVSRGCNNLLGFVTFFDPWKLQKGKKHIENDIGFLKKNLHPRKKTDIEWHRALNKSIPPLGKRRKIDSNHFFLWFQLLVFGGVWDSRIGLMVASFFGWLWRALDMIGYRFASANQASEPCSNCWVHSIYSGWSIILLDPEFIVCYNTFSSSNH